MALPSQIAGNVRSSAPYNGFFAGINLNDDLQHVHLNLNQQSVDDEQSLQYIIAGDEEFEEYGG